MDSFCDLGPKDLQACLTQPPTIAFQPLAWQAARMACAFSIDCTRRIKGLFSLPKPAITIPILNELHQHQFNFPATEWKERKDIDVSLWIAWMECVWQLRGAFHRERTFLWVVVILASFSVRSDLAGVTSFVRAHWLIPRCYHRLLDAFHSQAVDPSRLRQLWSKTCLKIFSSHCVRHDDRVVLLADGIKAPKEGRKMPGVKCLHQESSNNSKPEYVMAHSCQAVSLLVRSEGSHFAVPLSSRIHEGVVFSNRDGRTLLDKLMFMIAELDLQIRFYLVADAYYASGKVCAALLAMGCHLVSRVRSNAVAYEPIAPNVGKRKRGRPQVYGKKVKLKSLFADDSKFTELESPIYGEKGVILRYRVLDLIWRPLRSTVRFVWVAHPTRGHLILMSTDLNQEGEKIIDLYGLRFKIEVSFKQAIHTIGAYGYHFWMKAMDKIRRGSGDQYLHRKPKQYREQVMRKLAAYEFHIQLGLISQGLLQYLSITFRSEIWKRFSSWLRTMRTDISPSEAVTAQALQTTLPEFLEGLPKGHILKKFLCDKIDWSRCPYFSLAG